jgi:hypothetical protein
MEMPLSTQLQPSAPLDCVGEGKIQTVRLGSQLKLTTHCHPLHLIFRTHVPTAGGLRAVLWAATRCVVMPAVFVCEQLAVARVAWPSVTCVCAQCLCELAINLSRGGRTVSLLRITDAWSRTARAQAHRANGHALLARTRTSSHTRDAQCAAAVEGDFLSSHVLVLRRLLPRVGSAHGLSLKRALCASACLWPHLAADHPDLLCARTLRPRRLWWSTARIRRGSARRGVSRPLLLPSLLQADTVVAALLTQFDPTALSSLPPRSYGGPPQGYGGPPQGYPQQGYPAPGGYPGGPGAGIMPPG